MERKGGFTLIEVLLVIGIIAILAAIVIIAINPGRQLAQARNAQRQSDVNTLVTAISEYLIDNEGELPAGIPTSSSCSAATQEICSQDTLCSGYTDLSDLVSTYLVAIPTDPTGASGNGSGYAVVQSGTDDRITVCAPDAELGESITVSQ